MGKLSVKVDYSCPDCGELHQVQRLETKLRLVNDAIKRVGLKEMNMILWERYGKA